MKLLPKLLPVIIIVFISCTNSKEDDTNDKNPPPPDTSHINSVDTLSNAAHPIPVFIVDDYPVTNEMLNKSSDAREIKIGNIRSLDKAWFYNDTLQQVLVFELYTDNHRLVTYHFSKNDIPAEIIKSMDFTLESGDVASLKQKQTAFTAFIDKSQKINSAYFVSDKGFRLGDTKEKVIALYGQPDKSKTEDGVEQFEWDYTGDLLYYGKPDLKGKPLAKNSYGHQAVMFFRNNKLTGYILHNDIP